MCDIDSQQRPPAQPVGKVLWPGLRGTGADTEQLPTPAQGRSLDAVVQVTIVADAQESTGQHVLQKTANKLISWQGGDLLAITVTTVTVSEAHLAIPTVQDAVVRTGHAMRVTAQVVQKLARPGKRGLRVNNP